MITMSGMRLRTPFCSQSRLPLNQTSLLRSSSVCTAPTTSPPTTAIGTDLRPPMSAPASAGTTSAVRPTGVIVPWIGPTTITASVAVTDASTQLIAASRCGE